MKARIRQVVLREGTRGLEEVEDVRLVEVGDGVVVMGVDGSTTNTGIGITIIKSGRLYLRYTIACRREQGESAVEYKVELKRLIEKILSENASIKNVYYEQPFIQYATAAKQLLMLRTSIEEVIAENGNKYKYIKYREVNNLRWKKALLDPMPVPQTSEGQKKAVKEKISSILTYLPSDTTQDEYDAIGIASACSLFINVNNEEGIGSTGKPKAFKFKVQFFTREDEESVFAEILDIYTGPSKLLENGVIYVVSNGVEKFDNIVYRSLIDVDGVVIIKLQPRKYGNVILKYRLGELVQSEEDIYCMAWRVNRIK